MYGRPAGKSSRSLATCGAAGTRRCGRTERAGGRAADRPPQRAANRGPRRRDGAGEPRRREWTDGTARGRDRQQAGAAAATGSCSPSHDSGWTGAAAATTRRRSDGGAGRAPRRRICRADGWTKTTLLLLCHGGVPATTGPPRSAGGKAKSRPGGTRSAPGMTNRGPAAAGGRGRTAAT